jgi:oligopeptide transport system ATP-binding protein
MAEAPAMADARAPADAATPAPGAADGAASPLLQVENLSKHYIVREGLLRPREVGRVRAVDGVSFAIRPGETLGLVGESGCGKSTVGKLVLHLIEPSAGRVVFAGQALAELAPRALRAQRREMQIVFQDPNGSLDPRMRVEEIVLEPLRIQGQPYGPALQRRAAELLEMVGLSPAHARRFPHEFSGGQRQRIGIARAIASHPKFIVCDEAVSALDVSVQAQIVNLLQDLQRDLGLSYLFIAHDLAVVKHISDRVAVMYLGKIVEIADKRPLYAQPLHPYTQALIAAIPVAHPRLRRPRMRLTGDVGSALAVPAGCRFHPRCPHAQPRCSAEEPPLRPMGEGRLVACHFAEQIAASSAAPSSI